MSGTTERAPKVPVAPLVPLALAFGVGIVADRFGVSVRTPYWGVLGLLAGLAAALGLWRRRWAGSLAVLVLVLTLGAGWHHAYWSDLAEGDLARSVSEEPRPAWVRGVLRDVLGIHPGDPGLTRAILEITSVYDEGSWRAASGRALLGIVGARPDLVAGDMVEAAGNLARVAGPLNPGEFNAREYDRAQGVRLHLAVDDGQGVWRESSPSRSPWSGTRLRGVVRAWSHARLVEGLDSRIAPLAAALLLGQREGVDP